MFLKIFKLALLSIAAIFIAYGYLKKLDTIQISGAIIFVIGLAIGLVEIAHDAKKFKKDKNAIKKPSKNEKLVYKISRFIEVSICIGVLVGFLLDINNEILKACIGIIYFGSILIWLLAETMISWVTKLPLQIGYFNRYNYRSRNRKRL